MITPELKNKIDKYVSYVNVVLFTKTSNVMVIAVSVWLLDTAKNNTSQLSFYSSFGARFGHGVDLP